MVWPRSRIERTRPGVCGGEVADEEERGAGAVGVEEIEGGRGGFGGWAVVEGEPEFVVRGLERGDDWTEEAGAGDECSGEEEEVGGEQGGKRGEGVAEGKERGDGKVGDDE